MEKKFTSDEVPLAQLLDEAAKGKLQLPDFQRGWVWDDDHIKSLLASISLSYPIGAVMTLQTGNPDVQFKPRALQGVQLASPIEPETLLLDGQQRSTSLYLALKAGQPVPTRDSRGKEMLRRYFADIGLCIDSDADREDAIVSVPADGLVKNFRGEVQKDLSTREKQVEQQMFPLEIVLDVTELMGWQQQYLQHGPGTTDERWERWLAFQQSVVNSFVQYQVPTIQLIRETPKEAVCAVFEKVNTGGVSLNVFELLTATYAADNFNLREDWEERRAKFKLHEVLGRYDATSFVQTVTLLATFARRREHLHATPGDEKAPAVSCKRRDMLRLPLSEYERWADVATKAAERVVPFLHTEHVFRGRDLPYPTQIVPLAAMFAVLGDEADTLAARQSIARWYWCGVFGEMYGGSTETRFALDLSDVVEWITAGGLEPRTMRDSQFQADRLLSLRTRNAAAYKGVYALQMKRGARDFRTGQTIDLHAYAANAIDVHHIFPIAWCQKQKIDAGLADSIVNKTPVDAQTNRRMGGRAPSEYLAAIENRDKTPPDELDAVLRSHEIDPFALRQDEFAGFFSQRFERLLKLIEAATGKAVNRSADGSDDPFATTAEEGLVSRVVKLIDNGESSAVEFKSTGRKNLHTGEKDPKIEWSVLKSIAGFANASGGTLLVGVEDDGSVRGIEEDFPFVSKQDTDGWALWLTDAIAAATSKALAADLTIDFCAVNGGTVAKVGVSRASAPVFARMPKGDGKPIFMVRTSNSTQELHGQDLLDYKSRRW